MAEAGIFLSKETADREVWEYRTGSMKTVVSYPKGADVRINHCIDVENYGEKPVTTENMLDDYFQELPVPAFHADQKKDAENG
jgi:hypothetical protein